MTLRFFSFFSFRDQLFCIASFICGLILLIFTDVIQQPFLDTQEHILVVFAFNLGHYVYRFFQDILLREFIPLFKMNLLHHVVTISTYTVFIWYEQNAMSGIIGLLFEGSSIIFEIGGFLKAIGVSKNSMAYITLLAFGFTLTVIFRGVVPVILLILTTLNENPLKMQYIPLGFFFMNIVFFSMVNGWLMKSSLQSLRKRLLSRRIISELRRYQIVRNREGQNPGDFELNNLGDARRAQQRPVTVIIPADNNFRLARPVSNFNMDYSRTLVSNLTVSRRERTLPNINIIVSQPDVPPASITEVPSTTQVTGV